MLQRILFMGPPGCGKGTYAKHVAPLLGASHVSTGDLVRNEVKRGTPLGNRLHAANTAGALVDDSDILELLLPVLKDVPGPVLLDGYPRTLPQATALQQHWPVDRVVAVSMDAEALVRKGMGRRHCNECDKGFNIAHIDEPGLYMPAVLPDAFCVAKGCLDRFSAREDDTEAVIRQRLAIYHEETLPALAFYQRIGEQRDKALQALAMVLATPAPTAGKEERDKGTTGSGSSSSTDAKKNGLVVDVAITGGFDVMAPVFEAAVDLKPRAPQKYGVHWGTRG